jgi:excisionase family DNA binding protein
MQPLKSVEEAAGLLGISPWTVRSYLKTGKLKAVRLGRRVLVEEAELERFVARGKAPLEAAEQGDEVVMGSAEAQAVAEPDQANP